MHKQKGDVMGKSFVTLSQYVIPKFQKVSAKSDFCLVMTGFAVAMVRRFREFNKMKEKGLE